MSGVDFERVRYINVNSKGEREWQYYNRKVGNTQKRYMCNKGNYIYKKDKIELRKLINNFTDKCIKNKDKKALTDLISYIRYL